MVGNREIGTTRESSVQDLQSVLTVQKKAFLEEGTPDLKKRLDRLRRLAALLRSRTVSRRISAIVAVR